MTWKQKKFRPGISRNLENEDYQRAGNTFLISPQKKNWSHNSQYQVEEGLLEKTIVIVIKGSSHGKKTVKKGDIVPFWRPPPLNGSKGDICCLITDKSA